ncbi:hypothetical protein MPSEU_000001300 [Mayamaea pseudoterrestris]|nr:hypothetical protein MPSEU_000001300 [Mayamaea pseudoterrestris]
MQAISNHTQTKNFVEIELPFGGSLKDVLVFTSDDATAVTECFSISDSSSLSADESISPRCVHFDMDANISYLPSSPKTSDERDAAWYTKAEYKVFRRQAHVIAGEISVIEQHNIAFNSYERTITRIHKACELTAYTDQQIISYLSAVDRRHLHSLMETVPFRHGLEKWSLPTLSNLRSLQRLELQSTIIDLQKYLCKDEDYHETLRSNSERLSKPAQLFSHYMAESLAHAEETAKIMI